MRAALLTTVALVCAALSVAPAEATDSLIPNLKGEWVAEATGIGLGDPDQGVTVDAATTPAIRKTHLVMTIDFQEGRHIAGIKRHARGQDRFVGVVRLDNRSVVGADAEGDMGFRLMDQHEMEVCYTEHSAHWAYASCEVYHRAH